MNIDDLFARFDGAYEANTLRAYRGDYSRFRAWCANNGIAIDSLGADDVVAFVDAMVGNKVPASLHRWSDTLTTIPFHGEWLRLSVDIYPKAR